MEKGLMSFKAGPLFACAHNLGTKRITALLMSTWFLLSSGNAALAHDVSPGAPNVSKTSMHNILDNTPRVSNRTAGIGTRAGRFDLDLTSTSSSIVLGSRLFR